MSIYQKILTAVSIGSWVLLGAFLLYSIYTLSTVSPVAQSELPASDIKTLGYASLFLYVGLFSILFAMNTLFAFLVRTYVTHISTKQLLQSIAIIAFLTLDVLMLLVPQASV